VKDGEAATEGVREGEPTADTAEPGIAGEGFLNGSAVTSP